MARATWKFSSTTYNDMYSFFSKFLTDEPLHMNVERNLTINALNCPAQYRIYQGKVWAGFEVTHYHFDRKAGELTKTRKPFFFRSKKKKR